MYCSDDRLKSNFHRIRAPNPGEYQGPRNTVVYFTNPNLSAICQVGHGNGEVAKTMPRLKTASALWLL